MTQTPDNNDPVANLDAADGDWIKRGSFDLPHVNSVADLNEWLVEQHMTVEHFKSLEIYRSNVERISWLSEL